MVREVLPEAEPPVLLHILNRFLLPVGRLLDLQIYRLERLVDLLNGVGPDVDASKTTLFSYICGLAKAAAN